ncbi:MAG: hypothetical protein NDI69_16260 [Bacteriovoracaceae bacterium]|nr:hypothetical protein [Bacteriovoracaceae bacterium]
MKKLIFSFTLLSLSPLLAQANCNKKIDPSKVMLFVDTNNSELEIITSQKAACERGERLVVVPKNYKDYKKYTDKLIETEKRIRKCLNTKAADACKEEDKHYSNANSELAAFKQSQPSIRTGISEAMAEIKATNGKLQVFTVSGHDGGGSFGGNKGDFSRYELAEIMKEHQDINETTSILLLGCYTGVQNEIYAWKSIFPSARMIAGYDGSAPLADRPQGHQYITDLLLKEKELLKNSDEKKLMSFAQNNIKSLNQLHAAMYVNCEDDTEFYYGSDGTKKNFKAFNTKECLEKKDEIKALAKEVDKYQLGILEPPLNTQAELRQLYNKARRYEHCLQLTETELNVSNLFNLLFYQGVKESFASYYKDDLSKAESILADLDGEVILQSLTQSLDKQQQEVDKIKAELELMEKSPETYLAQEKKKLEELQMQKDQMLKDPAFASVKNMIDPVSGELIGTKEPTPEQFEKLTAIVKVINNLNDQAHQFVWKKNNLPEAVKYQQGNLAFAEQQLNTQLITVQTVKESLAGKQSPVWVPTFENLDKKSRAETLKNINNMHGLLSVQGLPEKQQKALRWLSQVQSNHLVAFQNPFSWHEFTGRAEAPMFPVRLDGGQNPMSFGSGYFTPIPGMGLGGGIMGGSYGGQ